MPRTKFISNDEEEKVSKKKIFEEEAFEEKVPEKKVRKFDANDGIRCRSIVQGGLYMEGKKTNMTYSWTDYGDISEVEYRDLVAEIHSKSRYIFNPWFIIEDEDFLEQFPNVRDFYERSYTVKDLKKILNLPVDQMIEEINKLPNGAKDSIKSIAAKQVSTGVLDSVSKIKALDNLFGTDLNLIGSFFDE